MPDWSRCTRSLIYNDNRPTLKTKTLSDLLSKMLMLVFAVTNFWETIDAAAETRQGMNVADVAKVRHTSSIVEIY